MSRVTIACFTGAQFFKTRTACPVLQQGIQTRAVDYQGIKDVRPDRKKDQKSRKIGQWISGFTVDAGDNAVVWAKPRFKPLLNCEMEYPKPDVEPAAAVVAGFFPGRHADPARFQRLVAETHQPAGGISQF
jgi:hypothetical protein